MELFLWSEIAFPATQARNEGIYLLLIQYLCNVNHFLCLLLPVQSTRQMHETACLGHDQDRCFRLFEVTDLSLQPLGRKFGMLHRKDAPKSATQIGFRQIDQRCPSDVRQKGARLTVNMHAPQRVTGGMIGEGSIPMCAEVGDAESIDKILGEFVDAISNSLGAGQPIWIVLKQLAISMFEHVRARAGRDNNIPLRFFKNPDRMFHDGTGLCAQAGVEGRLSAAGLIAGKFYGEAETAENTDNGLTRLRVERIDQASDEKLHRCHESIVIGFRFRNSETWNSKSLVSFLPMDTFRTQSPDGFNLPKRLGRLSELAYNLWWTWQPESPRVFGRLDYDLWEQLGHNPIRLLREIDRSRLSQASRDKEYRELYDRVFADFDLYMNQTDTWTHRTHPELTARPIAYFSMEFGLHETLPIYSGGLGVLAGDHLKEASDLGLPLTGIGFMYAEGYFSQRISDDGWQEALNNMLDFRNLPALPVLDDSGNRMTVDVEFPDRIVTLGLWEILVGRVPLYLLDSNLDPNTEYDKQLTARLYWSDLDRRVMQELLLGVGGVRALRALGYNPSVWHMNEGHAAFLILERARELVAAGHSFEAAMEKTRGQNVFTTHTPVAAGNDEFPLWLIEKYLAAVWPSLN